MFSVGITKQISPKITLKAEEISRYGVLKTTQDTNIREYLWGAGLNLVCYIKL